MQELHPQAGKTREEYLMESPAVLTGRIASTTNAGWTQPSIKSGPIQPVCLRVEVEHVLKGTVTTPDIEVYTFMGRGSMGGLARTSFNVGEIYILYLRRQSGEWRTACDVYESCVDRIRTGRHPLFKKDPKRPLSDDILQILLTRGDVSDGTMVDALEGEGPERYASDWRHFNQTAYINLLQQSAQTESPPVRAEACELLNDLGKTCR